jgi:uncharacterized membrane protein
MSRVTVGAPVVCTDGPCGELVAVLIDPAKKTVTHYIVRVKSDDVERMVPTDRIGASTPEQLELQATLAEVNEMESFTRDELLAEYMPDPSATNYSYAYYYGMGIPDVVPPDPQYVHIQSDRIPQGEVSLREGTEVKASDGHKVGKVSALVTDNEGVITHFVLQDGDHEVTLPLATVNYSDDEGVHLKLSRDAVHGLPGMPKGHGKKGSAYQRVELVAKVFDSTDGAHKAHDYLNSMANEPGRPLRIREWAEFVRDADGTARIVQSSQPSRGKGAAVGAGAGALLTLLGPVGWVAGAAVGAGVGAVVGPKMDMGFPDEFLKRLEKRLQPGNSALLVLVEHDFAQDLAHALADTDKVIGGQQIVDTLVQEMLVEEAPAAKD